MTAAEHCADMIQNHVMQLLALTAMEPPSSLNPESIRDEKVKALKALKPLAIHGENPEVVRASYAAGLVGGKPAKAYLDEEGILRTLLPKLCCFAALP